MTWSVSFSIRLICLITLEALDITWCHSSPYLPQAQFLSGICFLPPEGFCGVLTGNFAAII